MRITRTHDGDGNVSRFGYVLGFRLTNTGDISGWRDTPLTLCSSLPLSDGGLSHG